MNTKNRMIEIKNVLNLGNLLRFVLDFVLGI